MSDLLIAKRHVYDEIEYYLHLRAMHAFAGTINKLSYTELVILHEVEHSEPRSFGHHEDDLSVDWAFVDRPTTRAVAETLFVNEHDVTGVTEGENQ